MGRRLLSIAPLLVLLSLFVFTGIRGVDLGQHWDEVRWHINPVRDMVTSGVFLQHAYDYPALSKWLVLLPAWPAALWTLIRSGGDPARVQAAMKAVVDAPNYLLTARCVFIVVSALAMAWVYGAVLVLRRKPWEALVAAGCIGLSWQYAYHARWVANDCVMTQFAALMLLFLALFERSGRQLWLYLSAVAVGLATGTKQPGVFLLIPVIAASVMSLPRNQWRRQLARIAILCAIAGAVFILTTPGVILEPFVFIRDGRNISKAYARGWGGFTRTGVLNHVRTVLIYLAVVFFSPYKVASVAIFASAVVGAVAWMKQDRRVGIVLLVFPLGYLAIFCSRYVVMIARNYLQLTPFLSIMAARGVAEIYDRLKTRWARGALVGVLSVIAVANAVFLVQAAESIRHVDPNAQVRDALAYVAAHPARRYRVSDKVRAVAARQGVVMPPNVVAAPAGEAVVVFGQGDMGSTDLFLEDDPWLTEAIFGPREVDFNWYAVWGGNDRVVVMPIEKARVGLVKVAQ